MHLKGRLSINLVVLVVILLLDGEKFLVREEDVFVPILSVPLEEMLYSCPLDLLESRSKVSLEQWCPLTCRSSLMRHNLIGSICSALGSWSSLSRVDFGESAPCCFDSGFSPHTFRASWPSPVFNTLQFLIAFNCPIDKILRNFQWFQEFENLKIRFATFVKGNHSHMIFLETPRNVNTARDMSKLPWHKYLKGQ